MKIQLMAITQISLLTTPRTFFAEQEVDFGAYWLAETCVLDIPVEMVEDSSEKLVRTSYTPLGVVVGIVPWNCE